MKITGVEADNRKRGFAVETRARSWWFPYAVAQPPIPRDELVEDVSVDAELGREAFTYTLTSGETGSVHLDAVLEYNEDPAYMAELAMYELTTQARARFEGSALSAREIARRLGTSPAQLYRLLDPANRSKSMRQLLSLLTVLGYEVDFTVKARARGSGPSAGRARG